MMMIPDRVLYLSELKSLPGTAAHPWLQSMLKFLQQLILFPADRNKCLKKVPDVPAVKSLRNLPAFDQWNIVT
ncbi:MAG: hypothetical protein IPP71_19645 [Bacteroidetes bacterium]|nr:hypothetical protein [Bacteroidota bacterium]